MTIILLLFKYWDNAVLVYLLLENAISSWDIHSRNDAPLSQGSCRKSSLFMFRVPRIVFILKACEQILSSDVLLCLIVSLFEDCFDGLVEMELLEVLEEYEELEDESMLESDNDGSLDGLSSDSWISLSEMWSKKEIVSTFNISLLMTSFSFICCSLAITSSVIISSDVLRSIMDEIIEDNYFLYLSSLLMFKMTSF